MTPNALDLPAPSDVIFFGMRPLYLSPTLSNTLALVLIHEGDGGLGGVGVECVCGSFVCLLFSSMQLVAGRCKSRYGGI